MTDVTVTTEAPPGNSTEARLPDGTLKDVSPASTTPSPETKPEGTTFLTEGEKKPEVKPEIKSEEKPPEGENKPDAPVVPEKYADFKLPDGFKMDEKTLPEVQAAFKEMNLTQDQAQKLVDLYAKTGLEAAAAPYKQWADLQKEWTTEIANRFPGEKATATKAMIKGVFDSVLPPSLGKNLIAALDLTGAGSHPDVVEALSILLKPLSEGKPVRGNGPSGEGQKAPGSTEQVSIADAMYGHLRK